LKPTPTPHTHLFPFPATKSPQVQAREVSPKALPVNNRMTSAEVAERDQNRESRSSNTDTKLDKRNSIMLVPKTTETKKAEEVQDSSNVPQSDSDSPSSSYSRDTSGHIDSILADPEPFPGIQALQKSSPSSQKAKEYTDLIGPHPPDSDSSSPTKTTRPTSSSKTAKPSSRPSTANSPNPDSEKSHSHDSSKSNNSKQSSKTSTPEKEKVKQSKQHLKALAALTAPAPQPAPYMTPECLSLLDAQQRTLKEKIARESIASEREVRMALYRKESARRGSASSNTESRPRTSASVNVKIAAAKSEAELRKALAGENGGRELTEEEERVVRERVKVEGWKREEGLVMLERSVSVRLREEEEKRRKDAEEKAGKEEEVDEKTGEKKRGIRKLFCCYGF